MVMNKKEKTIAVLFLLIMGIAMVTSIDTADIDELQTTICPQDNQILIEILHTGDAQILKIM